MTDTTTQNTPAYTVHGVGPTLALFTVNEDALRGWIDSKSGELDGEIPDLQSEAAGAQLAEFFDNADQSGVIQGDPRLSLDVNGEDDSDGPGFYAMLHNEHGSQRLFGLTTGWTSFRPAETATPEAALDYLHDICDAANRLIWWIQGSPDTQD
ncbi:hypothetical protein [Mycobacteroides abscessus]|uniref:hypothetical protein n=1 Tax=Mycobacteroides abscessus TaxID=36809 RepID=UPI0021064426|nr:hypothetical protein [Mycobacteroides abscessus]